MKKYILLLVTTLASLSSFTQCLEITSIFVDACGPSEGENEMFTFETGASSIDVNDITIDWPNNNFLGWCQDAGTAASTDALNATIINSCGFLVEPTAGEIPANSNVLVITSTNISLTDNSFAGLSDTLYIIYQCAGNTSGHFANSGSGIRTLTVDVTGSCSSTDVVSYDRGSLVGGDGSTVLFDAAGNPTYINNGCNAPIPTLNAFWSFTNEICQDYGDVDLNSLLDPSATLGGTWSGDGVSGSNFNPQGFLGEISITYTVTGAGDCSETLDSSIVLNVDTVDIINTTEQSCDSVFVNGNWYSGDTLVSFTTPGIPPYGCETVNNVTIEISGAIIDSSYLFGCDSVEFDGIWYTSSTELRDTISSGGGSVNTCDDLFFSEYGEGSGFNKYIEIYNGTGVPVDLSAYTIQLYSNGSGIPTSSTQLSGFLPDGETFVIVNNNASPTLLALADLTSGTINFNGDDAFALRNNTNGDLIDLIGNIGCASVWTNGSLSTANNTIIRNPNYTDGVQLDPIDTPCDFPTLNALNWTDLGNENWSNVGTHTANCGGVATGGCDTIIITTIEIAPPAVFDSIFLCTNEASETGIVNDTLNSALGCDSLITVTSTSLVIPTEDITEACTNDPALVGNDTTSIIPSILGCDSVFNVTITSLITPTEEITEACTNDPALVGNDTTSIISSALGCDSIYNITVSTLINPTIETLPNITGCEQVDFDGTTYNSSTTLNDTILSSLGCDSIYQEREIIVNQPISIQNPNNPIIICDDGELATLPDGSTVSAAGTYPITFPNAAANGCDSTIITDVITENCGLTCELDTASFESYEFVGPVPGIVPGATFQPNTTEATGIFAGRARTGDRFLYMNIQNGYTGIVYSINMDVCPGSEFNISFWIRQYDNGPGSNFDINIYDGVDNSAPLLSTQNIVNNGTTYNERVTPTSVPTSPVITFELVTIAPGGNGNDICFDDLLLQVCQLDTIVLPTETFCSNDNTENLYDYVSSVVGSDGVWSGPSNLSNGFLGTFDPSSSNSGTYFYTKAGTAACVDTIVQLDVDVLNTITAQNPNNPIIICSVNDSTQLADGSFASSAGSYPIVYTNGASNGCDSTFVTIVETEVCEIQCNNPISLGADQNLCFGESIILDAGSGYDTYEWQDGSENQTFTVNSSGTYFVTTTEIDFSNNLVVNGDFEQGNTGFTTDYVVGTGGSFGQLSNPGTYAISTSPSNVHNNFSNCGDNTTGSGNMYIANGSDVANTEVWCQNINVTANTDYLFSAWAGNALNDNNVAILQFSINGNQIGSDFSPSTIGCDWQQFSTSWNSGINTSAQICIINQNTSGGGNDFILDDIFFTPFCEYTDTVEIEFSEEPTTEITVSCTNIAAEAGTFTDTILNNFGCDSIYITTEINLLEPTENIVSIECTNDEDLAGISTDTILSNLGCDSIYNISQINFVDLATETFTLEGCDSVRIGGITYFENFISEDTILSSLGCDSLIEILDITVNASPIADAGEDVTILEGESTILNASGGDTYTWNWINGDSQDQIIEVSPTSTTEYIVTVSENNCSNIDTVVVFVEDNKIELLIPNAFSPNNDGVNDVFQIVNADIFSDIEMSIYNRWGELIHQGSDINHGWDGSYKGQDQAVGVYIYYVKATSNTTNETFVLKGSLSLIR